MLEITFCLNFNVCNYYEFSFTAGGLHVCNFRPFHKIAHQNEAQFVSVWLIRF